MTKRTIDFKDLETDRAGIASKAAFVALANELIADGRCPHNVFCAMLHAAYEASLARSTREHYAFMVFAAADTADWEPRAKKIFDAELNSPETQAFLKEIGIEEAFAEAEKACRD